MSGKAKETLNCLCSLSTFQWKKNVGSIVCLFLFFYGVQRQAFYFRLQFIYMCCLQIKFDYDTRTSHFNTLFKSLLLKYVQVRIPHDKFNHIPLSYIFFLLYMKLLTVHIWPFSRQKIMKHLILCNPWDVCAQEKLPVTVHLMQYSYSLGLIMICTSLN